MILTKLFIVLIVIIAMVTESESTHQKGQDQYKPIIKLLKAAQKAEKARLKAQLKAQKYQNKYQKKYGYVARPTPSYSSEESDESSEEWRPFHQGPYQSHYPYPPPNHRPNGPGGISQSSASASAGGNGGSNSNGGNGGSNSNGGNGGGGQYPILRPPSGERFPSSPGGSDSGGFQDPIQQINRGLSRLLEGLFRFPSK